MANSLEYVQGRVGFFMDQIVQLFKPGVKISVFVRTPDFPDRDFTLSDDDLEEVKLMIDRRLLESGESKSEEKSDG